MTTANVNAVERVIEMREVSIGTVADPNVLVAEGVDWAVARADFWVIGGLQGVGKTDFAMTTAGLVAPVSGSFLFFGQPMPIFEEQRLDERLRLGMVFDGGRLFNHLTVGENVSLPLRYHRNLTQAEADPELRGLLALCELEPWVDSTPGTLARAWQKRVGLARALMLRPEVLVLDNPLAGLDLRHRTWWLQFLGQLSQGHPWLNNRPATLIIVADDFRPWQNRARHFAVLKNRRLIVLGNWDQLKAASDDLVRELIASGVENG